MCFTSVDAVMVIYIFGVCECVCVCGLQRNVENTKK